MNEENKGFCRGVFFCCSLALAITALVIAGKYDGSDSDCDNDSFTIGLPIFLKVAGGVALSAIVLGVLPKEVALIIGVPVSLFDIVWAAIGLNIYANQMSSDCQNEAIGIMVLVWSIIQISLVGVLMCCSCCLVLLYALDQAGLANELNRSQQGW